MSEGPAPPRRPRMRGALLPHRPACEVPGLLRVSNCKSHLRWVPQAQELLPVHNSPATPLSSGGGGGEGPPRNSGKWSLCHAPVRRGPFWEMSSGSLGHLGNRVLWAGRGWSRLTAGTAVQRTSYLPRHTLVVKRTQVPQGTNGLARNLQLLS